MRTLKAHNDPLGSAVQAYYKRHDVEPIWVESDIAEDDIIPVQYLFGSQEELPPLERLALDKCSGRILDVGAAAGRHSLILQEQNKEVTALDISELCCQVMQERGVNKVIAGDFYQLKTASFDTLLFLMNGIGIAGTVPGLDAFLAQARKLLKPSGQILFDSSDIDYMYQEDDGSKWVNLNSSYQGELNYRMYYKNIQGEEFPWLFIDMDTLKPIAAKHGFEVELLARGEHYDYLGKLKKLEI